MNGGKKAELIVAILAIVATILAGAFGTVYSYGRLAERIDDVDERLARIERLLDSQRTVAGK